jgi:D-alanyl-D-alanine carboxypeptidase (penicillin-binding protein 5/6)
MKNSLAQGIILLCISNHDLLLLIQKVFIDCRQYKLFVFMHTLKRAIPNFTLVITVLFALNSVCANAQSVVTAYSVIDGTSGHVLESVEDSRKLQIGSLTKIATAMVVLDWAEASHRDLAQYATVPAKAAALAASNPVGFQPGDRATLRDLLYAALIQSDNIAALTLATHVGQTLTRLPETTPEVAFVAQMNALARRLKMEHTLFLNPHGLDDMEGKLPYSTSSDLARLAAYAMARSAFRFYVSQKERQITVQHMDNTESHYLLRNTNDLLGVNSIDGVKTGATRRAGQCVIISSARQPESVQNGDTYVITPRRLVVVVLGSTSRFSVAATLLNRGWQLYDQWAAKGRPLKKNEALIL